VQQDEEAFFLPPTSSVVSPWYLGKVAAWLAFVVKLALTSSIGSLLVVDDHVLKADKFPLLDDVDVVALSSASGVKMKAFEMALFCDLTRLQHRLRLSNSQIWRKEKPNFSYSSFTVFLCNFCIIRLENDLAKEKKRATNGKRKLLKGKKNAKEW
jgi:hypothetical protein